METECCLLKFFDVHCMIFVCVYRCIYMSHIHVHIHRNVFFMKNNEEEGFEGIEI